MRQPVTSKKPTAKKFMRSLGLDPDPWQLEVLEGNHRRLLLNCSRQAGKSTAVAAHSLHEAIWNPGTLILLVSRSFRQAQLLFRLVARFHQQLDQEILERCT